MQNANSNSTSASNSNYINLQARGIGYLGRVRSVKVRKGNDFMSATINAMSGEMGVEKGISYTPFDVKAVGKDTEELLKRFEADAADDTKRVTVQFTIGDFTIHTFDYKQGPRQGQVGTQLKGRLLKIQRVWIKDLTKSGDEQAGNVCVYTDASLAAQSEQQRTGTEG